ncbi:MAG: hypothetical protein AB7P97_21550 [Hyphomonadaceae bacterium]
MAEETVYEETMTARVNVEDAHREVILRGTDTPNTIVFRNQPGTEGFVNGETYRVSFEPCEPPEDEAGREDETDSDDE